MSVYFFLILFIGYAASGIHTSVLGTAWPAACQDFGVAISMVSYANMLVAGGRVFAATLADKLVRKFGTYKVVSLGYFCICLSLIGCAFSRNYSMMCISCIPLGFGDTLLICSLNTFTAVRLSAKHVSWMNMVWSLGSTAGPYAISLSLANGRSWNFGYFVLSAVQVAGLLTFLSSKSSWDRMQEADAPETEKEKKPRVKAYKMKGMPLIVTAFFCYLAIESISSLWGSSYITVIKGLTPDVAALGVTFLFVGMTVGRFLTGFITEKLGDKNTMHVGQILIVISGAVLFLASGEIQVLAAMCLLGLGCAPIFPCFVHYMPTVFGVENTGSCVGFLMAFGEVGALLLPTAFGWVADFDGMWLFPVFHIFFAVLMMSLLIYQKKSAEKQRS